METLDGIGVSQGVAVGRAVVIQTTGASVRRRHVEQDQVQAEEARYTDAVDTAIQHIRDDQNRLAPRLGENLAIFETHIRMLDDPRIRRNVIDRIRTKRLAAEAAVDEYIREQVQLLAEDPDTARWVADFYDVQSRLQRVLLGRSSTEVRELAEPSIIVAENLMPSQTVGFERDKVLAIAMEKGGKTSHTAIIANALGIPAVVGVRDLIESVSAGEWVIVDGGSTDGGPGHVMVGPDDDTRNRYSDRERDRIELTRSTLDKLITLPAETLDGRRITLYANIEFPEEAQTALENGAEGIGLYRTEYLYLEKGREPTEEEHFEAYRAAAELMWPRPVVIRTFDLGADKATGTSGQAPEQNPFLGCRSIRLCFERPGMFRSQIRAILRASLHGYVKILLPMITSLAELRRAKGIVAEVCEELDDAGIEHEKDIEIGIMIEVPSAALMAEAFAKEADFFSIGTNDLIQYTLAVDRGNPVVAHLFEPAHPAVARLIRHTIHAGDAAGIPVAMCGQMSGDLAFLILLLGLGLRQFSTSPKALPRLKRAIRELKLTDAFEVADQVLKQADIDTALHILADHRGDLAEL